MLITIQNMELHALEFTKEVKMMDWLCQIGDQYMPQISACLPILTKLSLLKLFHIPENISVSLDTG